MPLILCFLLLFNVTFSARDDEYAMRWFASAWPVSDISIAVDVNVGDVTAGIKRLIFTARLLIENDDAFRAFPARIAKSAIDSTSMLFTGYTPMTIFVLSIYLSKQYHHASVRRRNWGICFISCIISPVLKISHPSLLPSNKLPICMYIINASKKMISMLSIFPLLHMKLLLL